MELDDGDAVVAAALALIDDVYGADTSASSPCEDLGGGSRRRVRCHERRREEIQQLRQNAEELRHEVERLHASRWRNNVDRSQLWSEIAIRQRDEREKAVRENALLREAANTQLWLARRMRRVLDDFVRLQTLAIPCGVMLHEPLKPTPLQLLLRQRIEEISGSARLMWMGERVPINSRFRRAVAETDTTGNGMLVRVTSAMYHPYKLSVVSVVIWKLLAGNSINFHNHESDEIWSNFKYRVDKPSGLFEAHGPSVLQRVYCRDGSVVMAWTSTSSPQSASGLLHGLEIHETAWVRIQRVPVCTNDAIVYTESVHSLHIQPSRDDVKHTQAEQLAAFVLKTFKEDAEVHRQQLENHLLDATSSCWSAGKQRSTITAEG